jgi:hypothetical protein
MRRLRTTVETKCDVLVDRFSGEGCGGAVEDACGEDNSVAVVVKSDGKGEDAPGKVLLVWLWNVEQAPVSAVDVGLAGVGDGLDDVAPVAH